MFAQWALACASASHRRCRYTHWMQAKPFISSLIIASLVIASIQGCGQTGPLYLPDTRGGERVEQADRVEQPDAVPSNPTPESRRDRKTKPGTEDVPATDTQTPAPAPDPSSPAPSQPGN